MAERRPDSSRSAKPVPAAERQYPLPWQQPKPAHEDPDAPQRVRAILASPSYRQADQDSEFLRRDDMRAVRLQLDYQKPQLLLDQHEIEHTIVVFGGTRIREPDAARRALEELHAAPASDRGATAHAKRVAVAERIVAKSRFYDVARQLGRLVGQAGDGPDDCRVVIATGGGPGIMEAANRGAYDVGAKTVGFNINLPHEQYPNPYITPELCFSFHYFAMRKLHFLLRAKALVVFPGGFGTFDELFEALALVQTRKIEPLPIVLVDEEYWRSAFDVDFLVDEGVIDEEDRELLSYADTAEELWAQILEWHRTNGRPLFNG